MKFPALLLAGVMGACSGAGTTVASATPTAQIIYVPGSPQIVYASPSASPAFSPRKLSVMVAQMPPEGDALPAQVMTMLLAELGPAWDSVTTGRSHMKVDHGETPADIVVLVLGPVASRADGTGNSGAGPYFRLALVHEDRTLPMDAYLRIVIHELGHILGCCRGDGADDGKHVANCPTRIYPGETFPRGAAIMCPHSGDAPTFNDYELSQMGL